MHTCIAYSLISVTTPQVAHALSLVCDDTLFVRGMMLRESEKLLLPGASSLAPEAKAHVHFENPMCTYTCAIGTGRLTQKSRVNARYGPIQLTGFIFPLPLDV